METTKLEAVKMLAGTLNPKAFETIKNNLQKYTTEELLDMIPH